MDQLKCGPSMVTFDFFLLRGSEFWNFLGPEMNSFDQILIFQKILVWHKSLFDLSKLDRKLQKKHDWSLLNHVVTKVIPKVQKVYLATND